MTYKAGEITKVVNYWLHPKAKKQWIKNTKRTVYRGKKSIWYRSMKMITVDPKLETGFVSFNRNTVKLQ